MNTKEKFLNGVNTVKHTVLGAATLGTVTCAGISALGVAGHVATPLLAEAHLGNDYSLKNRFKTAYCFDATEEEKHYDYITWYGEYETARYVAHPIATYGVIAMGALLGAAAGAANAREENEERRKKMQAQNQKCR